MLDSFKKIFTKDRNNKKFRILVVDDSAVDRNLLVRMIERLEYTVDSAENGTEGIAAALKNRPDLIVLDYEMPDMTGVEMVKRLKEHSSMEKIPILFVTAVNTPSNIIECFEVEAANYVAKPVNTNTLAAQITTILKDYPSN